MKATTSSKRKCSAFLAAGAGAAVCFAGGDPGYAAKVTGLVTGSNAGATNFAAGATLKAFSSLASWHIGAATSGRVLTGQTLHTAPVGVNVTLSGNYAAALSAGVVVGAGISHGFAVSELIPPGLSDKYLAVSFTVPVAATRYGWIHVVSTTAFPVTSITVNKWGYENTGATIKTLSESLTTRKLDLSDGRAKLHWANTNEDGVARYEIQSKDASGAWHAVDSNTPGEGGYSLMVAKDSECRLVVEMVDGATHKATF